MRLPNGKHLEILETIANSWCISYFRSSPCQLSMFLKLRKIPLDLIAILACRQRRFRPDKILLSLLSPILVVHLMNLLSYQSQDEAESTRNGPTQSHYRPSIRYPGQYRSIGGVGEASYRFKTREGCTRCVSSSAAGGNVSSRSCLNADPLVSNNSTIYTTSQSLRTWPSKC